MHNQNSNQNAKLQGPKGVQGSRALDLKFQGFRGSKTAKIGALGFHGFTLELHLARIIFFVRAPSTKRLWSPGSTENISGLQGSKDRLFETLKPGTLVFANLYQYNPRNLVITKLMCNSVFHNRGTNIKEKTFESSPLTPRWQLILFAPSQKPKRTYSLSRLHQKKSTLRP